MATKELCYRIEAVPDLSLRKYSSLDDNGVNGVLKKHLAFLRQWNRKGALSGTSVHLFYYFDGRDDRGQYGIGEKGNKLEVLFLVRGEAEKMKNVPELVSASTLSDYFKFSACNYSDFLKQFNIEDLTFPVCSTLLKKEVIIRSSLEMTGEDGGYYTVPQWEINEDGRLYNMSKLMEALDRRILYRVDLYPVERGSSLREALRKPMSVLRERQYNKTSADGQRDYEAENVLKEYQGLLDSVDSSPHFIANAFVFGDDAENSTVVLDAAGAEALKKGNYEIATFNGKFTHFAFFDNDEDINFIDRKKKVVLQKSNPGLVACKSDSQNYKLRYLPTLFTLEEAAPFFRFPTLFEGEVVQKRKETAPKAIPSEILECKACGYKCEIYGEEKPTDNSICPECGAVALEKKYLGLYLGSDDNGYDVYFPLRNLAKHAFIAGVPGSGKTNTMHHLASTLWKKHKIPFLVLEPAKQEYRALANQPGMEELYIFSPNANMQFPLHINPFEFPKGLMVAEHIRRLCSVFEGAFPLDNPMPFLLDTAIEAVYRELGWSPESVYTESTALKFPTMSMLYKRLEDELKITTYSEEIRGNLESALKVRIGSLLRREMGDVFDVPCSTIAPEEWLTIPAIIELESMGTGPANFLTLMLCALIREALKVNPNHDKEYARHVIFIEEAHNLIGPEAEETSGADANPKQAATAFVVKMLAEVRALKEGIIIADQLPTVMAQEVIKNTGLKIGLRITSSDDRGLLGSTMAANSLQMEEMATFNVGRSLISYEGLMRPFTIQTHEWCGNWAIKHCSEVSFDINWCETECRHYRNGDCIPDKIKRDLITVPKSDADLVEFVRETNSFKRICERSFVIESTRFSREYAKISDQINGILIHIKKLNEKDVQIRKLEAHVFEMSHKLISTPDWENNQEQIDVIHNTADYVNQLKIELSTKYLASEKFRRTYGAIVDCILLVRKIQDRKKHWVKLGITDFKNINNEIVGGGELSQIQRIVVGVNDIQKAAILLAQQLFVVASPHLPNASKVRAEIEVAISTFKVKNILPRQEKEGKHGK